MYDDNTHFVFKVIKHLISIALGIAMFVLSKDSFEILSQTKGNFEMMPAGDFYQICVWGGAGLALAMYSMLTMILKIIEYIVGFLACLCGIANNALENLSDRWHEKRMKQKEKKQNE